MNIPDAISDVSLRRHNTDSISAVLAANATLTRILTGEGGVSVKNGVVMAAFGRKYIELANRAAESFLRHNPGLEVDLFTDARIDPGTFSRIHVLPEVWIRSKVDAMLQSRFERTLYLDADVHVLADLGDIFEVLERFDIAAAQDQNRNSAPARLLYRETIANAFPQINGGVIGLRRSPQVTEFLEAWKCEIKAQAIGKDQPSLRELLWNRKLRVAVLPPEYNLWDVSMVDYLKPERHTAPRILHSNILREFPPPPPGADILGHYLGKARAYKIGLLLAADETLALRAGHPARVPTRAERNRLRRLYASARAARLWKTLAETLRSVLRRTGTHD